MTAPGGGSAAAVWVSVLPDLSGFGAQLARDLAGVGPPAGERVGREMGQATESGFSKAVKGLAAIGAVIGAGVGVALVGAMNVEAANDKLSAQLGLTAKDAERYGKVAGDLYSNNYGDSLETVNEALRQVTLNVGASATSSDADLQRITAAVLDVSTAFDQDLGGTTAAVGQLMKTGLATDATQALDIITAGFQGGADKAGDFLDTLNEYGGQFQKLGIDGATATGLLTQGLQAGARDADLVADAFKEFSIRAIDGSKLTGEGFQALGLDGAEMARKIAAGGPEASGALDLVLDRLRAMPDPVKRSQTAVALFGTQAEDLGAALFALDPSAAVAGLGEVGGAAARMGETLNDNAGAKLEAFKRQITTAFVDIVGGRVLPIVTSVAAFLVANFGPALSAVGDIVTNQVLPAVGALGGFIDQNRVPIAVVAGLITAIFLPSLIAMAVQSTVTAVTTTASWLATQAAAIIAAGIHSVAIGAQVAGWVVLGAQSLANAARVAAAWLIAMGPIGLVIVAVVGLVALIIANWDTVKAVTAAVFSFIGNFLTTVWNGIVAVFNASVTFLVGLWNSFWSGVQAVATAVWNGVRTAIEFVWNLIKSIFTTSINVVATAWRLYWDLLSSVASTVFNAILGVITSVWDTVRGAFSAAIGFISGLWSGFWNGLSAVASSVFNGIKGAIDTVIGGIINAFRFVVDQVGNIWAGIKRLLAVPINFLINTVYNNGIVRAWNFVAGIIPGIGPISTIAPIPEFARGGPVMSDTILRAGEAGPEFILSAPAVEGLGGMAAVEQLHEKAIREPLSLRGLNSGNIVEGADHEGPGYSTVGFGGVKPHVAKAGHFLKQKFGIGSVGGVGQRANASDHPRGLALDFMTYNDQAKGDRLVNYLVPNAGHFAVKYIIWKQRINSGSGWRPMEDRGSVTANHFDHPHVSFLDGPGGGGGFSGEGGGFLNPLPGLIRGFFNTFVNPLVNAIPGGPPKFLDIPKGLAGSARDKALEFFLGLAGGDVMDSGGLAWGRGFMAKDIIEPERVLSPRQTVAFERLVRTLDQAPFAASLPTNRAGRDGETSKTLDGKLDELIGLIRDRGAGASITVEDRSGNPQETARATQLALRMA